MNKEMTVAENLFNTYGQMLNIAKRMNNTVAYRQLKVECDKKLSKDSTLKREELYNNVLVTFDLPKDTFQKYSK